MPAAAPALPNLGAEFDPKVQELIALVTVASFPKMWPDATVHQAGQMLMKAYGRLPSLDDLAARFGSDAVTRAAKGFLEGRKLEIEELAEQIGIGSPCHLCAAQLPDGSARHEVEFALARDMKKKTNWGGFIGTLALNAVTLPLGLTVIARPGSTKTATLARCRFVLCGSCAERKKGFFGQLDVSERECAGHPSWTRLHSEGFTKFIPSKELKNWK
jgi:hypothetical protein